MWRVVRIFRVVHLDIMVTPLAGITSLALWLFLGIMIRLFTDASPGEALSFGIIAMLFFWLSVFVHHLGHAIAAHWTRYPMVGIRIWAFGTSLYPADEGPLPSTIHIQRALGGPILSTILGLIALPIAISLGPDARMSYWVMAWLAALNLITFGPGALVPLSIGWFRSDGATILHWMRQQPGTTA